MRIPFTQSALCTTQCKQNHNGVTGKQRKIRITKPSFMFLLGIAILASTQQASAGVCPMKCSCDDGTAYCNNLELTSTPVGFAPSTHSLYFFNNNISVIQPDTLRPLQNLKMLDISGNRISFFSIWDGVFSKVKTLENLLLQENKINKISKTMFKGLTKLMRIYLQYNQISIIEEGSFDNLPNLLELKLNHNRLISFPKLRQTPELLLLDLSYNRLRTIRDMAFSTVNLEYLKLPGNQLTQIRTSLFDDTSRLTKLDISNNRLTAVPQVIKSFIRLSSLNMSLNNVSTIPINTFKGMTRLKVLDIHNTGLTDLPFGTIPQGVVLNVLDLTGNDLKCGCALHWLPEYMSIFRDAFIGPEKLVCSEESKLGGKLIEKLTVGDFGCTEEELAATLDTSDSDSTTLKFQPVTTTAKLWRVDPCDVYHCSNDGSCFVNSFNMPMCRCAKDWTGDFCQISLTTSTAQSTETTTTPPRIPMKPEQPKLLIHEDTITENSVEIMIPITDRELAITIGEVGQRTTPIRRQITPKAQPFTVEGLEPGKSYNICIHLPINSDRSFLDTDTLCGVVRTENAKPNGDDKNDIRGVSNTKNPFEDHENTLKTGKFQPDIGDEVHSSTPEATNFKIIYPAVGSGVGAIIIVAVLVMFFFCRRNKKMKNYDGQNNPDYIQGAPANPSLTELELATVVHHHHHNHYTAEQTEVNSKIQNGGSTKKQKYAKFTNNNPITKPGFSHKTSSLGRTSNSSSSNSGTIHSRYTDTPQHYQQQYLPPTPTNHQQYEPASPQRPNARNDYVYRQQNNNIMMQNNHCVTRGRHYGPDLMEEIQPMMGDMSPYPPYPPNDAQMYQDPHPINHRNDYMPPVPLSYQQNNPRSAFQPIQGVRKNTVRTPTSESGPITTHANSMHILPTSTCHNRNLIGDNMLRYQESLPVA